MVGRRHMLALLLAASALGCSQILDLDEYSPRPDPSSKSDGGPTAAPDAGPLPVCMIDTKGSCMCVADTCAHSCPQGNCTFVCGSGATCDDSCSGAGCTFICAAGSTCLDSCSGGNCTFACDPAATCSNTCTGGSCK